MIPLVMSSLADSVEAAIHGITWTIREYCIIIKVFFTNINVGAKQIKNRNKPRFHDVAWNQEMLLRLYLRCTFALNHVYSGVNADTIPSSLLVWYIRHEHYNHKISANKAKKKSPFKKFTFQRRVWGGVLRTAMLASHRKWFWDDITLYNFFCALEKYPTGPSVKCIFMAHHLKSQRSVPSDATHSPSMKGTLDMTENMIWKPNDTLVFLEHCWVECECDMICRMCMHFISDY